MSTYYIQEQNIALYARQMLFMELLQNSTTHGSDSDRAGAFLEVSLTVEETHFFRNDVNHFELEMICSYQKHNLFC